MRGAARRLGALIAFGAVIIVVVSLPALLVAVAHWPLPTRWPNWSRVALAIRQRDLPDTVVLRAIAVIGWIVWAQLFWSLLWELTAAVRSHNEPRPSHRLAPGVPRAMSAGIARVVAVVFSIGVTIAAPSRTALVRPAAAVATATAPPLARPMVDVATNGAPAPYRVEPAAPAVTARWLVRPGDTLWGIATGALGNGARAGEITTLNPVTARSPRDLQPGQVLRLPADARIPADRLPPPDAAGYTGPRTPASEPIAARVVVVAEGDTLSELAQRHLGDEHRWPELWELNRGRSFDGRAFRDPDLIMPGWELLLPDEPAAPAAAPIDTPSIDAPPTTPAPLIDTPSINITVNGTDSAAAVATSTAASAAGVSLDTAPPGADQLVARGHVDVGIGVDDDVAVDDAVVTAPTVPTAPSVATVDTTIGAGSSAPTMNGHGAQPHTPARSRPIVPIGLAGATVLATGALGLVQHRRRRRLRAMGPRDRLAAECAADAATSTTLALAADPIGLARLDAALRSLVAVIASCVSGERARPLAVFRRATGDIEVVVTYPLVAAPPAPWEGAPGTDRLRLPAAVPLETVAALARAVPAPCPALVLLGTMIADAVAAGDAGGDEVYVDLEAMGMLVVEGGFTSASAVARAAIASLAVSPIADVVSLVSVGVDLSRFVVERPVAAASSLDDALQLGATLVDATRRELQATGESSTFALRASAPEEPWEPAIVVIVGQDLDDEQAGALDELAAAGGAVIVDRDVPGARWRLHPLSADRWRLDPLGIELRPHGLAEAELAAVADVLAAADAPPLVDVDAADAPPRVDAGHIDAGDIDAVDLLDTSPAAAAPVEEHGRRHRQMGEPDWHLLVRTYAPVEVVDRDGNAVEFERSKALELVVWLAHHRVHPGRMAARTALWEADVRDATFANVVSDARRAMARRVPPPEGEEWIARSHADRLPLHNLVTTDGELLANARAHARRLPSKAAACVLRHALAYVRDMPFAGTMFLWPDAEALPSSLIHLATSAAVEMAELCLGEGDLDGVMWATGQGLHALAGHEDLVCLRMRACAAAGNIAGVQTEFDGYVRALSNDTWGDAAPADKVVRLRAELLKPPPPRDASDQLPQ